ncbi:MAG: hypothetical protein KJ000_22625 [Pirellulaceae bacterium]|nr:hypothetical protein [Pirellulaceae bacterium]
MHLTKIGRNSYGSLVTGTTMRRFGPLEDVLADYPNRRTSIAALYIRIQNEQPILLEEITEQFAGRFWSRVDPSKYDDHTFVKYGSKREQMNCQLVFDNGTLIAAELNDSDVAIANNEDGPYYSLPLTRSQLIALCGEPNDVEVANPLP